MKIGEIVSRNKEIILNRDRQCRTIKVSNIGDRPIQVGSHYHFFEVNKLLHFNREEAYGYRLDIPSGTSIRFEPGEVRTINLIEVGGSKTIYGLNDLTCGNIEERTIKEAIDNAKLKGIIK